MRHCFHEEMGEAHHRPELSDFHSKKTDELTIRCLLNSEALAWFFHEQVVGRSLEVSAGLPNPETVGSEGEYESVKHRRGAHRYWS